MGFATDLIVVGADVARANFVCSVCMELVENGVTLKGCDHHFCKRCIDGVIRTRNLLCPDCRREFSSSDVAPASRLMNNILSCIKFRCPYKGCVEQIDYDNFRYDIVFLDACKCTLFAYLGSAFSILRPKYYFRPFLFSNLRLFSNLDFLVVEIQPITLTIFYGNLTLVFFIGREGFCKKVEVQI